MYSESSQHEQTNKTYADGDDIPRPISFPPLELMKDACYDAATSVGLSVVASWSRQSELGHVTEVERELVVELVAER